MLVVSPLPWNNQVQWANELAKEGDSTSQRALFRLGVEDKRLFDGMNYEVLKEIGPDYDQFRKKISLSGEAVLSVSGKHPLIISAPEGNSRLTRLHVDFDKGAVMNVLWEARR